MDQTQHASPKMGGYLIVGNRTGHASLQLAGQVGERGTKCRVSETGRVQCPEVTIPSAWRLDDKIPYGYNRQRLLLAFLLVSHYDLRLITRPRRRSQGACSDHPPPPDTESDRSANAALFCYPRGVDPLGRGTQSTLHSAYDLADTEAAVLGEPSANLLCPPRFSPALKQDDGFPTCNLYVPGLSGLYLCRAR